MFEVNTEDREILLYDVIGSDESWGEVSADAVHAALKEIGPEPVSLRLSSPGGEVWEALRMFNAIAEHGQVNIHIDGLAASAASYIAMAGQSVSAAENSLMMVHGPWTIGVGGAKDFRTLADALDKHGQAMAGAYAKKTGKGLADILDIFEGELWMTADEALEAKFIDSVGDPTEVVAKINNEFFHFENCPKRLAALSGRKVRFQVDWKKPKAIEVADPESEPDAVEETSSEETVSKLQAARAILKNKDEWLKV